MSAAASPDPSAPRTVFVIDDNDDFRDSLGWLLETMGYAFVEFADPHRALAALTKAADTSACCVLLDVRMPTMSGLDLHERARARGLDLPVIYMTGHADVPLAVAAMRRGALTFLEKPLDEEALEEALEQGFSRQTRRFPSPGVDQESASRARRRLASLPGRERQIADGIVAGLSNRDIAERLGYSVKNVEYHRAKLMRRLEARNVAHLCQLLALGESA